MLDYIPRTPNPSQKIKTLHSSYFTQKRRKENGKNIKVDKNLKKNEQKPQFQQMILYFNT